MRVEEFISELSKCDRVFCEAMHGAIIADALRIPSVAISSANAHYEKQTHQFKWTDWCHSMEVKFNPIRLPSFWHPKQINWRDRAKAFLVASRLLGHRQFQLSSDQVLEAKLSQINDLLQELNRA